MKEPLFAREGWKFLLPSLFLALSSAVVFPKVSIVFFFFVLFFLLFFRNPSRKCEAASDVIVSPADGKVVVVDVVDEPEFIGGRARRIAIFMSPLDVHVNRVPCSGRVAKTEHRNGKFALAFKKDLSGNERNYILIDYEGDRVLVVQIAGFLARRIVCDVSAGDDLKRGDRVGMITFGSRVDIYFPEGYDCDVAVGDTTRAGLTRIATKGVKP